MISKAKKPWLEAGIRLLEERGAAGLTIEELTRQLNLTKGSFYHHFKSRDGFVEALLEYWEEEWTLRIIRKADAAATAPEKARVLTMLTMPLHESNLELHIRAWALSDERARAYVARVDRLRLRFLEKVGARIAKNKERGQQVARALFAVFTGAQQIVPPIKGKELIRLYAEVEKLYER